MFNLIIVFITLLFFLLKITIEPVQLWDARSIWFFSGKIIYFNDDETLRINLEKYLQMSNLQNMNKNNDFFDKFTWEQTCSKMLKVYENC